MSVLVLTLSLVPCSDAMNECKPKVITHEESSHSHKTDHDDFCSPFCSCNCCGATVVLGSFGFQETLNPVYIPIGEKVISYSSSFIPSFYENIWQPPKINA
jgi:hypothetical protein